MAKMMKRGRAFPIVGVLFICAGLLWVLAGKHIAIGLMNLAIGIVFIAIGASAMRKTDTATGAAANDGSSDAPSDP